MQNECKRNDGGFWDIKKKTSLGRRHYSVSWSAEDNTVQMVTQHKGSSRRRWHKGKNNVTTIHKTEFNVKLGVHQVI